MGAPPRDQLREVCLPSKGLISIDIHFGYFFFFLVLSQWSASAELVIFLPVAIISEVLVKYEMGKL